jgi:hypothetical protein
MYTTDPAPGGGSQAIFAESRRTIVISGSSNITINNLNIVGPDTVTASNMSQCTIGGSASNIGGACYVVDAAGQNGVETNQDKGVTSSNITLTHLNISHVYGDGVVSNPFTNGLTVEDNVLNDEGRNTLSVYSGQNVTVVNNDIGASGIGLHFDIEPFDTGNPPIAHVAENVNFSHNYVTGSGEFVSDVGANGSTVNNITISDNYLYGVPFHLQVGGGSGSVFYPRSNYIVSNNISTVTTQDQASGRGAVNINNVNGMTISGNKLITAAGSSTVAVSISNSSQVNVNNNWFQNVTPSDILVTNNLSKTVTLTANASAGATTIQASSQPPDLTVYQLGSGTPVGICSATSTSNAEIISEPSYGGGQLNLGEPLLNTHYAGEPVIAAPDCNYSSSGNSADPNVAPSGFTTSGVGLEVGAVPGTYPVSQTPPPTTPTPSNPAPTNHTSASSGATGAKSGGSAGSTSVNSSTSSGAQTTTSIPNNTTAQATPISIPFLHTKVSRQHIAALAYVSTMTGSIGMAFGILRWRLFLG